MDYEALKAKEQEMRAKREKLLAECEQYEKDIRTIQKEMAKLDHTNIRLDDSTEWMLRQYIDFHQSQDYHHITFYKYYPRMFPTEEIYHEDSIIKIVKFCEHKSAIISLSEHAFEICGDILGESKKSKIYGDVPTYTWILRGPV
jgi:predicted nuclease with TOPRIM domain